jgi:glutathione synthase/RimK-type ligase-like ATP-grasp enzyme
MPRQIIVVESFSDWKSESEGIEVVHVDDYLTGREFFRQKNLQVINFCRRYKYQSVGYFCSLLAEARGHRVLPAVKTMLDLSHRSLYTLALDSLDKRLQHALDKAAAGETSISLNVFFGYCSAESLAALGRQLFESFPTPLLHVRLQRQHEWRIVEIKGLSLNKLDDAQRAELGMAVNRYRKRRWRPAKGRFKARYDLAILHDPDDAQPPSNQKALQNFIKSGRLLGLDVELITRKDYGRLAEYDALFIRDTTNIDHYTYRFAKKAESETMVVLDDPRSILLCTNKVYLAELLRANNVSTPRTLIVGKGDLNAAEQVLGYPMVLKLPDGSFSQGVFKAENREQLNEMCQRLFKQSELILAQEFFYTDFDWRIGILNRQPIFASQYFMSKKHWQIVKYDGEGGFQEGGFKTWPIEEAPPEVVSTALQAASLIGDGLYGVDVKQNENGAYVIEVNDNPNIEAGVEDAYLKERLYTLIMSDFLRRLESRHNR